MNVLSQDLFGGDIVHASIHTSHCVNTILVMSLHSVQASQFSNRCIVCHMCRYDSLVGVYQLPMLSLP